MKNIIARITSTALGIIFLISGWMKGVDPYGVALKMEEYLGMFGLYGLVGSEMVLAVLLCSVEIFVGLMLVFGLWRRAIGWVTLGMMIGFTGITAYLAFDPMAYIQECGCFGEAVSLTNTETFIKNIVLLLLAALNVLCVRCKVKDNPASIVRKIALPVYLAILAVGIPIYSLVLLPPFDFMDYNRGADLKDNNGFSVFNADFIEVTDSLMAQDMPWFAIVAQENLDEEDMENLAPLYRMYEDGEIGLSIFTSNEIKGSEKISTYLVDAITLKSMLRAEKGVIRIDDGRITGKWKIRGSVDFKEQKNIATWYFLWIIFFIFIGGLPPARAVLRLAALAVPE